MANPSGTRTRSGESDRIISPKDAFFPPTSPTSARPIWENQRTKRMRVPPSSEHVFTTGGPRIGRSFWNGPLAGPLAAGASPRSHRYAREGQPQLGGFQHETDLVDGRGTGAPVRMRVEQVGHEDERLGQDADRGATVAAEGRRCAEARPGRAAEGGAAAAGSRAEAEGTGGFAGETARPARQGRAGAARRAYVGRRGTPRGAAAAGTGDADAEDRGAAAPADHAAEPAGLDAGEERVRPRRLGQQR